MMAQHAILIRLPIARGTVNIKHDKIVDGNFLINGYKFEFLKHNLDN